MGRCPDCGGWNTMVEESQSMQEAPQGAPPAVAQPITQVSTAAAERFTTGLAELDRVLGGGVVPGSLVLIGGEPGIGKSTLLLQAARNLAETMDRVLVVSAEESMAQVRMRADRLGALSDRLLILSETDLTRILACVEDVKPQVVVIDSIQTIYHPAVSSAPGSVGQVRECTGLLLRTAKSERAEGPGPCVFVVGHVTKEGALAGPRVLEHMVDTVLYFEGEGHQSHRVVRAVKNRFGSTDEIGVFEMTGQGLTPVVDPSRMFLDSRQEGAQGSVVVPVLEGTRCLLVEIQALVSSSYLTMPRRQATGVEYNRLNLVLAVLDRKAGIRLGDKDVLANVAGGIKVAEPAADLGIALAVASSYGDSGFGPETIVVGEVGLSGEVRAVNMIEQRLNEASKLGFEKAIIPDQELSQSCDIELTRVRNIQSAVDIVDPARST